MSKTTIVVVLVFAIRFIPIILCFLCPWLFLFIFSVLEPNPPIPKETYGEFPFTLEYTVGEDTFIIDDILVCKYDGVEWDEGNGKHRTWKEYIKSTGDEALLIYEDQKLKVYCNIGKAEYYMDDYKYTLTEPFIPQLYCDTTYISGSGNELLDTYDIKLIDWQLSKPIENTFE